MALLYSSTTFTTSQVPWYFGEYSRTYVRYDVPRIVPLNAIRLTTPSGAILRNLCGPLRVESLSMKIPTEPSASNFIEKLTLISSFADELLPSTLTWSWRGARGW